MGASQVVAEWTATGSGQSGAGGAAAFSPERKASTGVLSGVGPGQREHQLMRQINGELLAHGQVVKGQVVMRHCSRLVAIWLGMVQQDVTRGHRRP